MLTAAIMALLPVLAGCTRPAERSATSVVAMAERPSPGSEQVAPVREYRNNSKGLTLDGRLWLRGSGFNNLTSLTLSDGVRTSHFADSVIDLAASDGKLVALRWLSLNPVDMNTDLRPTGGNFVLSSWTGDGFRDSPPFKLPEMPLALIVIDGTPTVLSPHRISTGSADGRWSTKPLHGEIRTRLMDDSPIVLAVNGLLYIGHDLGEWGGGLQRLDPTTGIVTDIERRDNEGLCAGPLNSDCDPVTGLIQDPDAPGCVLASTGLAHMTNQQGGILKICGDRVSVVFEKAWTEQFPGGAFRQSEPFYGLVEGAAGEFWAISADTLYRFKGTQPIASSQPKLAKLDGNILISRDVPGHLVIYEDQRSLGASGPPFPILIARE